MAADAFRCLPSRPVRFSTAPCGAVVFHVRRTVLLLTPISAAIARSDFSGFAAIAASARFPAAR